MNVFDIPNTLLCSSLCLSSTVSSVFALGLLFTTLRPSLIDICLFPSLSMLLSLSSSPRRRFLSFRVGLLPRSVLSFFSITPPSSSSFETPLSPSSTSAAVRAASSPCICPTSVVVPLPWITRTDPSLSVFLLPLFSFLAHDFPSTPN